MANVLNRTSKLYIESVNTPDFPETDWVINPDLTAVEGYASAYWLINPDDTISLMSAEDRADVDTWLPYMGTELAGAIRIKQDMINEHRELKLNGGWLYKGIMYDSDAVSRSNMTGVIALIGTGYILPPGFTYRAQNNTDVPYDNASFSEFFKCSCIWANMIYKVSWYHKAEVKKLLTVPSIAGYDCSQGWPQGYEEGN